MKRTIAVLLCLGLLALSFAGCSAPETVDADPIDAAVNGEEADTVSSDGDVFAGDADALDGDPPASEWEFDSPENHGMDAELLDALHTALEGTQINSVVIVRDGVVVDEFYQDEYDETSVFRFNSCSKSVTSTLIGIAIDEGRIEGVDVPISKYFPELVGTEKEDITIRHLLEHRSGIEWYEFGGSAVSFWELNDSDNWVDYVLEQPLVATPGTTFTYTTGGTHLLGAILEQVADSSMLDYAQDRLFGPLGMDSVHWRMDPQGVPDAGNGVEMSTRDAAKFGQLFLNTGSWNGRQLVSQEWVEESTSVQVVRNGTTNGSYGYQWWILPMGGYDTYYALGAMGQFIVVVPELDLVVAVASSMNGDTNVPYSYLSNYILAACN